VAVLHTRAELLARELEREKVRVTRLLLLAIVALFFLALGVITFTLFVIVLFWDSHRVAATGVLTMFYLAVSIGLVLFIKRETARGTRPFASTIAELKKDREKLFSRP
jgi:uncharacterized membrane protein YqjE